MREAVAHLTRAEPAAPETRSGTDLTIGELAHRHDARDLLALLELEHIGDRAPGAGAARLRNLVHFQPVHAAGVGEAQQIRLRGRDEEVLDEIAFFRVAAPDAPPATALGAIGVGGQSLDVALVADRDDDVLLRDQRLDVERADPGLEANPELAQLDELLLELALARLRHVIAGVRGHEGADVCRERSQLLHERVLRAHDRLERGDRVVGERERVALANLRAIVRSAQGRDADEHVIERGPERLALEARVETGHVPAGQSGRDGSHTLMV